MTTKEYLEQYREDIPEWLKAYQRGKSRPLADFLKSRIVYYPGAWIDGDPVEVFGASHSAHCFVYADYWLPKDELTKELHTHGFRSYGILDEVSFSERGGHGRDSMAQALLVGRRDAGGGEWCGRDAASQPSFAVRAAGYP